MQPATTQPQHDPHPDLNRNLQLPVFASGFVGRQAELQMVLAQLESHSLVTIVGPGGMGKTRLAVQALSETAYAFADGVAFIELAPINTPDLLIAALAQHLGLDLKKANDPGRWLLAYLADKSLLLVLDNFEQLLDSVAFISAIRAQAPHVKLLITSRERLGVPGEVVVELRGLPVSQLQTTPTETEAAERLFVQVARAARPTFKPSDEDLGHIRRICALADGMPLAIELAAAWVTLLPVGFIADQVQQNLDWLTTSAGLTHSPQKSVRAVFDYFWNLLSTREQQYLRQLSVFRGGFERDMAQQVAGASLFFLSALVDRAFLSRSSTGRYQLHELLLQYASEQLRKRPDEAHEAQHRHAQAMLALAKSGDAKALKPNQPEWHARLEPELPNLRAALDWASQVGEQELTLQLVTHLEKFWDRRGLFAEACRWIQTALDLPNPALPRTQMKALHMTGRFNEYMGNFDVARKHLTAAIGLADKLGDGVAKSLALSGLCVVNFREGHFETGTELGRQAVMLAKAEDDKPAIAFSMRCYAIAFGARGNKAEAIELMKQSLAIARDLNDLNSIAASLNGIGIDLAALGQHELALQYLEEAMAASQQQGDRDKVAINLLNLGWVSHLRGDQHTAIAYNRQALSIFQEIGGQETAALVWLNLGDAELDLGSALSDVAHHYHQALTLAFRIKALPIVIYGLLNAVHLSIKLGQHTHAAEWVGFIMNHPSANQVAHTNAQPYVEDVRKHLPEAEVERLLAKGATYDLNDVVAEALSFLQFVMKS
jgi:predicted ATPase/Tfp pilus assembly protein PilF